MAYLVDGAALREALTPYLGAHFVTQTRLCDHAAEALRQYVPGKTSLAEITETVRRAIFQDLYEALGVEMVLQLENGTRLRIMLRDVQTLADEAVGVMLERMTEAEMPLPELRNHAMQHESLAAMRQMLKRNLMPMEREMLARIVRENDPLHRG